MVKWHLGFTDVLRIILILSFGLLSLLFLLAYFSSFISGPIFWAIDRLVTFFILPALGIKFDIFGILKKRTTLELVLLNGIVVSAGWRVIPEYLKGLSGYFNDEVKNNGRS